MTMRHHHPTYYESGSRIALEHTFPADMPEPTHVINCRMRARDAALDALSISRGQIQPFSTQL